MFGAILKATNSSFQKGMTFCRSIFVEKVMKLLAFIFEHPSYSYHVNINKLPYCDRYLILIGSLRCLKRKANGHDTCLVYI